MLGAALREARLKKQGGGVANVVPSPSSNQTISNSALPLNNSIPIIANKPIIQPPIPPANVTTPIKASISAAPAIKEPLKPDVLEWKPNPKYAKQFRYQKYINFKNMNVGDHVVKARMKVDGISDIDIESFFDCSEMVVAVGTPVTTAASSSVPATTYKNPTSLPMKADFSSNSDSSEWKPNNEYANKPQYIKYTNLKNQSVAEHMIRAIMKIDGILSKDQDGFFRKESVTAATTTVPATAIAGKTANVAPLSIADQIKAAKAAKLNVNVVVPPLSSPSDQSTAPVTLSPSSGSSSITSGNENINHFSPPSSPNHPHNSISSNSSSGSSSNNSPSQQPHHHHHSHQNNKSTITNLIEVNSLKLKPPLLPASQEPLRPGYTADGNYDHDQQSLRVKVSMLFLDPTAAISTNNTTATSAETNMSVFEQRYGKYIKMHKMNAVEGSIRQRMEIDGITQKSEQDAFFRLLTDHLKEEKKKSLLTSFAADGDNDNENDGGEEDEVISTHQQLQELKEEAVLQQQQQYQFMLLQQHHQLHSDSIDSMNNDDNISIADSVQTFNRPTVGTAASSDDYSSLRKKRVNAPAASLLKPTPLDTATASVTTNNQPSSPSTAVTGTRGVVGIGRYNQTKHHNNVSNNNLTAHLPSTTTPTATTVSVPTVKNILLPQDSFLTKSTLVRTRNPTPNRNSSSSTASNTTLNTISTHPKITSDMVITKSTITKARSYNNYNDTSNTNNDNNDNSNNNNSNTNLRRNYSGRPNILVKNTVNNPKVTHDMMITKSTITKAKLPNPKLTPDMVLTKSTVTRAHQNYNPYASGSGGYNNNKNNNSINTSTAAAITGSGLTASKLKSATPYGHTKNYIPFSDCHNFLNDDINIAPVVRSANNSEISFVAMMKRRSIHKSTGSVASVAATCGSHDENRNNGITNSTMTKTTPAAAAVSNVNSIKQPQPQQPLSPTQQLRYPSPSSFSERSDRNTAGALTEMAYQDYDGEEEGELEYHNSELNGENEFDKEQYNMMDDYSFYGDEEAGGVVKYDESHLPTTSSSSPIVVNNSSINSGGKSNSYNSNNNNNNNNTATTITAQSQSHSAQSPVYRPAGVALAGTDSSDVSSEADSASQYTDTDKIRPLGYVTTTTTNTTTATSAERVGSNKSLPKARPVSAKFKPKHEHNHHHHKQHGNLSEKSRGSNTSNNSTKSVGAIVNAAINTAISGKWNTSGSNNSSSHGDNNNINDDGSDYDEGSVQSHHTTVPKGHLDTKNATFFAGMIEAQRLEQKEREEMESKLDKRQLAELRRREEAERQHDSERQHHYSLLGAVFTKNKSPLSTPSTPRGSPFFPASPRTTAEPDAKANSVFQSPLLITTAKKPLIIVPPIGQMTTTTSAAATTSTSPPTLPYSPTSITSVATSVISPHSPHPPATHPLSPVTPSTTAPCSHFTSPRVPIDPRTMNAYTGEALLRALEDLSMRVKATADTVTATASNAVSVLRESLSRTNSFSNQINTSSHGNNNSTSLSSPSSKLNEREQLSSSIESVSSVLSTSLHDEQQQQGTSTSARRVSARRGSAVNMIKLDSQ